ncbi:uncharacterized protein LOC131252073 [Magnolia sinica]|uniref:uncharacterized protein LOC131252073 n=1 Tax=Magnolia sinica TaxID=86752 RepID=UPI0026585A83|nr:uncharacterized protein LOC131252073 [Magnolia sinica]
MDMDDYGGADDELFFADLKRRILSLMMDDDEVDGFEEGKSPKMIGTNNSPFPFHSRSSVDGWCKEKNDYDSYCSGVNVHGFPLFITEDPNMLNIWSCGLLLQKESNGTGVFIPRFPKPRRKPKAGRNNHGNIGLKGSMDK